MIDQTKVEAPFYNNINNISTTTTRIRGFTIKVLFTLKEFDDIACIDLANILEVDHHYLARYLYNLCKYGYVEKNKFFYRINDKGINYINKYINKYNYYKGRNKVETKEKQSRNKVETFMQLAYGQMRLDDYFKSIDLNDVQQKVVVVLIDHYKRTNVPYKLVRRGYDALEDLKINDCSLTSLAEAIAKLREEGIIYTYYERETGLLKVGLKKSFLQKINMIGV